MSPKVPPTVKLPQGATTVARRFIESAVARKNLVDSYSIVTEQIRQGQTLKSWKTGIIAVVPYPVIDVKYAPMKIDFSYPGRSTDRDRTLAEDGHQGPRAAVHHGSREAQRQLARELVGAALVAAGPQRVGQQRRRQLTPSPRRAILERS